jgi:outer membrane lipoprotein-sorting protein
MMRRPLAIAFLCFALATPAMAQTTLEGAMQALAGVRQGIAEFSEQKSIPELSTPLPSTGTLSWTAPDRLEKHTTWPSEETLRVEGDRLLLERPAQKIRQELSLDQSPEIRPFVEAIRATLAGDLPTLRQYYDVAFSPEGESWHMVLTPLSARIRVALQRVDIYGKDGFVHQVETQGNDGVTRLRITPRP